MKRGKSFKIYLMLALVPLLIALVACSPEEGTTTPGAESPEQGGTTPIITPPTVQGQGTIQIAVTDPGPADVKSAIIYLSGIQVHRASDNSADNVSGGSSENASESGGEWITIVGAPTSFDLMSVLGISQLLGSANVTSGKFTQIRMNVDKVDVVTTGGENITAQVPSDKLKIVTPFTVMADTTTTLTLDFDGEKSLVITGNNTANFKPVVKLLVEKGK